MQIIGVGTDVADVARFNRLLARGGHAFLDRWFRPPEVTWLLKQTSPARRAAAQFAAKEATLKAIRLPDLGPVRWREIEITHGSSEHLGVALHGSALELAEAAGAGHFHISTWDNHQIAMATVIAVSKAPAQEVL